MTEQQVDLDALIAVAETWAPSECAASPVGASRIIESLAEALESTVAELRKERERAYRAESVRGERALVTVSTLAALSRAEETIAAVRAARANHPECDVHDADDPVTCGWKRAVQDIDAALTDCDNRKETERG